MSPNSYEVELNDEVRHIDILETRKSSGTPSEFVEPPLRRSTAKRWLDGCVLLLIFLLPATYLNSAGLFITNLAVVLAIVLAGYFDLVSLIFNAIGPPDTPHVIAIIKVPERLYCPRCGMPKTQKYCSGCGVNVEKQYRKLVRQLATYAVHDTAEQRYFLEKSLRHYLQQVTEKHQKEIVAALEKLERNYVMEIVRQRKELRQCQQRLLSGQTQLWEAQNSAGLEH